MTDWSVNFGPANVNLEEKVNDHAALTFEEDSEESFKIFHLVMDLYEAPFKDYTDHEALANDKKQWRGMFLHYMIANHGLDMITAAQHTGEIKEAVDYCVMKNLITTDEDADGIHLRLTNQGERFISETEDENQYYIDKYEIFANTYVDDQFIEFDHDDGDDLRFIAMRFDEINPYQANMVINMFTGVFDDVAENWEQELRSDKFFARYLGGAAIAETDLTDDQLEQVMIAARDR